MNSMFVREGALLALLTVKPTRLVKFVSPNSPY
jgi:hypothetical protein